MFVNYLGCRWCNGHRARDCENKPRSNHLTFLSMTVTSGSCGDTIEILPYGSRACHGIGSIGCMFCMELAAKVAVDI